MSWRGESLFDKEQHERPQLSEEGIAIPETQRQELDRRLEAYHQHPESGSPWAEVRERIKAERNLFMAY